MNLGLIEINHNAKPTWGYNLLCAFCSNIAASNMSYRLYFDLLDPEQDEKSQAYLEM